MVLALPPLDGDAGAVCQCPPYIALQGLAYEDSYAVKGKNKTDYTGRWCRDGKLRKRYRRLAGQRDGGLILVFMVVAYALGKVFFPGADPNVQMIAALATFSVPSDSSARRVILWHARR